MTQASSPAFSPALGNRSRLIRLLTELSGSSSVEPPADFAERLSHLFGFSESLVLSAANQYQAKPVGSAQPPATDALEADVLQVRSLLVNAIVKSCTPQAGPTRIKLPNPPANTDQPPTFEPYHRFHSAHQREIQWHIRDLQIRVRNAVAAASPELKQLAILDAAYDEILQDRSNKLFATIPAFLRTRFFHLYETHRQTLAEAQPDDPATWVQPDGWLAVFCRELQSLLLAELDVRLQPVLGLLEALRHEVDTPS